MYLGFGNGFASTTYRDTFQFKYVNSGPGPGQYNPNDKNVLIKKRS